VATLLMNVRGFDCKYSCFVCLLLTFHKFLKLNQHFTPKKLSYVQKKVYRSMFDDEHCTSSLLLFRIGCLNFVFPQLSSQLALAGGV